jgi:hypothetical protein
MKEEKQKAARLKWLLKNGYTLEQAEKIVNAYDNFLKNNPSK